MGIHDKYGIEKQEGTHDKGNKRREIEEAKEA